jgi:hypothetical protein
MERGEGRAQVPALLAYAIGAFGITTRATAQEFARGNRLTKKENDHVCIRCIHED